MSVLIISKLSIDESGGLSILSIVNKGLISKDGAVHNLDA